MTSYPPFMLSPSAQPVPELTRAYGHFSRPSRPQHSQSGHVSMRSRSHTEAIDLDGNRRYRNLSNVSRGAERVREADARLRDMVPRSRGCYHPSDLESYSHQAQAYPSRAEPEYDFHQLSPRKRLRVSSENTVDHLYDDARSSYHTTDGGLAHTGSWCHSASVDSGEMQPGSYDVDQDILAEDWRPMTPMASRLSTPDLPPLSTDFEFCPCHQTNVSEDDKINEDFYFVTRSKMDMQMIDALAHIAQNRSVPARDTASLEI
ncbi:hypothetical protein NW762_013558 [Fusarium torreyae]|uniref:Uncharacterized protein n=1 Tax=Fusarium torreyae TaxID=1237075 RepID=A0A9W8VAB9_9HYPO|nr:hypothetical protein NW762_013558 [Fusarium torreyae]